MIKKKKKKDADAIASQRKSLSANGKGKAITWTRVSSEEQYKSNNSINTQLTACHKYCEEHNKEVKCDFGGTFESAKKAERSFWIWLERHLTTPKLIRL